MKKAIAITLTTLTILGATAVGAFASSNSETAADSYPVEVEGMTIYEEEISFDFAAPEM